MLTREGACAHRAECRKNIYIYTILSFQNRDSSSCCRVCKMGNLSQHQNQKTRLGGWSTIVYIYKPRHGRRKKTCPNTSKIAATNTHPTNRTVCARDRLLTSRGTGVEEVGFFFSSFFPGEVNGRTGEFLMAWALGDERKERLFTELLLYTVEEYDESTGCLLVSTAGREIAVVWGCGKRSSRGRNGLEQTLTRPRRRQTPDRGHGT